MPIANCIVSPECKLGDKDLIQLWSEASGISASEMTVNLTESLYQHGKPYKIMSVLYLPSIWSSSHVSQLQTSLAKALATCFSIPINEVHIITTIVESGHVVEAGEVQAW
ncbi:hypothetical protein TDB9533_02446 [Thalassocella blandensis]|nr:hypothetical protein TDB9533_02446 [Thalassocella blandensis]